MNSGVEDIVKYCIRPTDGRNPTMSTFVGTNHRNFTFDELQRLNVTSREVLLWSSSIDLAERYQFYIDQSTKSSQLNELFFNCTPPWFGVRCQYSFELVSNVADRIINVP
ncbi:unnamed protein product [Rotaria socialis]|uniref:Uncharacterized protein n=1 Tax=Rotaria socialis TaxID=392032 RepID=A0A821HNX1_9BILA|nr:unnamed protein product [Rotaria socialis]CAF4691254.1 unnamed protein product [Rotaria socialis]